MRLLLAFLFAATAAQADVLTCSFTEPNITVKYEMDYQRLLISETDAEVEDPAILPLVKLIFTGVGEMKVVTSHDNATVLELTHNNNGSDGQTDELYPFSAVLTLPTMSQQDLYLAGPLRGGCTSVELKTKKTDK